MVIWNHQRQTKNTAKSEENTNQLKKRPVQKIRLHRRRITASPNNGQIEGKLWPAAKITNIGGKYSPSEPIMASWQKNWNRRKIVAIWNNRRQKKNTIKSQENHDQLKKQPNQNKIMASWNITRNLNYAAKMKQPYYPSALIGKIGGKKGLKNITCEI